MHELVTIVIPVYNRPHLLRRAVASALAQTYRPLEIVIVDDGSTDDTPATITALTAAHAEVRAVRQENGGPGAARETGRLAARGAFLQFLDSDDLLLSHKLELQMRAFAADPEAGAAYGRTRYRDAVGREIPCTWKPLLDGERSIFPMFLRARAWETVAPLYRTAVCAAAGPWTRLRLEEDWEYDCRIGALGTTLAFVPEPLAEHLDEAPDRLSRGHALDPVRLRDRAAAHALIVEHARRAGVTNDQPEMQHFSRELFLLARQCGAAGLRDESRMLFDLSRRSSQRANAPQFRAYSALARVFGWTLTGRVACLSDRLRW
ncbi:MAG TPA: glycosyltransferase family A protein [Thermoanaerobaculia bacterium]|nr:glycosyltransferase family A protein [Thermoanaerobaculia bacterium]